MLKDAESSAANYDGETAGAADAVAEELVERVEKTLYKSLSPFTGGGSMDAALDAYLDWASHLASSPARQTQLAIKASDALLRLGTYATQRALGESTATPCVEPQGGDHRFSDPAWRRFPYDFISQSFLLAEDWWRNAAHGIGGVSKKHQDFVAFSLLQILDSVSPFNSPLTNPAVQKKILDTNGMCLLDGAKNLTTDLRHMIRKERPEGADTFKIGEDIAATPGKVIFRNKLMELIQYTPSTETVHPEPVLIVPAWIMKYYILDLQPHNSLIAYLVSQGFTVFAISWINPTESERDFGMDDYRTQGVMAAIDAIKAVRPQTTIHAAGYCLGGTLLSIAAAANARDGISDFKTITLFAAQTDFSEPGELSLFISEAQVRSLEDVMRSQGYLDSAQMSGAFQTLRANDLIWSKVVHEYLMGEREPMSAMMAWNSDGTRMPFRMHSEYLRELFLKNALALGKYQVAGEPVSLSAIQSPIFAVGTEQDHVAPWRSVYKIARLAGSEVTFALTNGGHNAGIVSEPGHKGRRHMIMTYPRDAARVDQDAYLSKAEKREGTWWPTWTKWLSNHSGALTRPPSMGKASAGFEPLCDAPGSYVLQE